MSRSVIVTGGTGFIGRHLCRHLIQRQYDVVVLSRNPGKVKNKEEGITYLRWDTNESHIDAAAFKDAFAIINLAGAGVVDKPWTDSYKQEILNSRVQAGETILNALKTNKNNIEVVINASGMGYYGEDKGGSAFKEDDPPGDDFLSRVCIAWENSIKPVTLLNKRLAIFRFGIVLGHDGGAMEQFIKPLKLRTATVIGSGTQQTSWIHIDDLCRLLIYAVESEEIQGIYNAVTPGVVSNKKLVTAMAHAMHGSAYVTVGAPAFALKLAMGERSTEVLKSTTVSSKKISEAGFSFRYPGIEEATQNIARELNNEV